MKEAHSPEELAEFESQIIAFVQEQFRLLDADWQQWLAQNPLPADITSLLREGEKINLADAQRYLVTVTDGRLGFQLLTEQHAELPPCAPKLTLEISNSRTKSAPAKSARTTRWQLQSVGYRVVTLPQYDAVVLHLDFVIEKTSLASSASSAPRLPTQLPQQTFMEARNMAKAITDGPRLISWEQITGGVGLRHVIPGNPVQTRILLPADQNPWDLPSTVEELAAELRSFELASVLLLNVVLGTVLQQPKVTCSIDALITAIGWQPRRYTEREQMRAKIWRWLLLFDSMRIHGKRPGKYWDKIAKKELDLTSQDAFIRVTGLRKEKTDEQSGHTETPLEVSWVAGAWVDQWRNNDRVLQYFGDIRRIAVLPAGKPSGAWAQSIGLALNQCWREQAARAEIAYVGEENKMTARFQPFTRWQLLSLFRAEPWVEDLLSGTNPQRAQNYWKEAIRLLRYDAGIIGHYDELDPLPASRKGWQEPWLKHQRLDIRPKLESIKALAEIAQSARRARHDRS